MANTLDVIILGAGPYGLSVAAHLKKRGVELRIFGKPMSFWQEHMPHGMLLRSRWWDTSLSDPDRKYSIADYLRYLKIPPFDPMPGKMIVDYGLWFARSAIPDIDTTDIVEIKRGGELFTVRLTDGRVLSTKNIVLAPGLAYYAYWPEQFSNIPKRYISHTFDNEEFTLLRGKRVVVIGSGQSALENSALMSEAGVDVQIIHRSPIDWLGEPKEKNILQYLRSPKAPISDGWDNWILGNIPYIFQKMPRSIKNDYLSGKGKNGPAGSHWLIPRLKNVTMHSGQTVVKVGQTNRYLKLTLTGGKEITADRIVLATGYRLDVNKLPMLVPTILKEIRQYRGSPALNSYFESSIRGLYFAGFSSYMSFGPLFRFVAGTDATAKRITQALVK